MKTRSQELIDTVDGFCLGVGADLQEFVVIRLIQNGSSEMLYFSLIGCFRLVVHLWINILYFSHPSPCGFCDFAETGPVRDSAGPRLTAIVSCAGIQRPDSR